jgi:para-nitrobenzyl esterase
MQQTFRSAICATAVALALPLAAAIPQPVRTANGPVAGVARADASVLAYKGIPFAAPPVGELRWRAPQAPVSWSAVRQADQYSASCIQNIVAERKPWTHEYMAHNKISEDCLYLNVWTPAKTAGDKLPVYFWIYGGGNVEGSTAVPIYDGENLARRGVVVVTINYRLGVFGFLAHPELTKEAGHSGNYGSLDQLAALQWVHKNIASFGGDPGNVTISGQSAGSGGVHNLVASPLANGLFHRAISESGSGYVATNAETKLADAEKAGLKFAAAKGAGSLKDLRAKAPEELMAKLSDGSSSAFRPVVDGYFLPAGPNEIFAQGKQNDVPELTGMNRDERSSEADYGGKPMAEYQRTMQQRFGDMAGTFFKLYPNGTQEQSGNSQKAAFRDAGLASMFMWGQLREKTAKNKSFTYYWTHPEPGPDSARFGAHHTSEVPYVFNTLNQSRRPWNEQDRKLADMLGSYWVNFMKYGDPNGKSLPAWPAYSSKSPVTMELGDNSGPRPVVEPAKLEFWQSYLTRPGAVSR